ncbi:MAG: hypothetical protein M5T61_18920 [Acidimicrobiia bacterium]|nr:hypothetical protein [Acidimicrobiia bacterium]
MAAELEERADGFEGRRVEGRPVVVGEPPPPGRWRRAGGAPVEAVEDLRGERFHVGGEVVAVELGPRPEGVVVPGAITQPSSARMSMPSQGERLPISTPGGFRYQRCSPPDGVVAP